MAGVRKQEQDSRGPSLVARQRRTRAAIAFVAALVAVAAVSWVDPLRPPDRFDSHLPGDVTAFGHAEVGETTYAYVASSLHEVTIDSAAVVVHDSSALAAVELVACTQRQGAGIAGSVVDVRLSDWCESVEPPSGATIGGAGGGDTYLLAIVQPLEPGRIFIDGVTVTHSRGPFHRTERTGSGIEWIVN